MTETGSSRRSLLKKWGFGIVLPLILIVVTFLIQKILVAHPSIGEAYARGPYRVISFLPAKFFSLVPISITEIFLVSLVLTSPFLLAWLVVRIVRAIKEKRGKKYFFLAGRITAWVLFSIYALFMLMYGINFTRYPLEESLGFGKRNYTVDELKEVYVWVVDNMNAARLACEEDENGVVTYPGGYTAFLHDMKDLYEESAKNIPQIVGNSGVPKRVALSHYWSYTDIVGMYFPFFAEPNVNVDVCMSEAFFTACHEMSHLHGYAVENDANFAAMLIGMNSSCPQLRYAGFAWAFNLIYMDLAIAFNDDAEGFDAFISEHPITDGYYRDGQAEHEYWISIEPPQIVTEMSSASNDTFLKINQQEDGEASYQMPTSNVADYYYTHVKEA